MHGLDRNGHRATVLGAFALAYWRVWSASDPRWNGAGLVTRCAVPERGVGEHLAERARALRDAPPADLDFDAMDWYHRAPLPRELHAPLSPVLS